MYFLLWATVSFKALVLNRATKPSQDLLLMPSSLSRLCSLFFICSDPPVVSVPNAWEQRTLWIQRASHGPAVPRVALWEILLWERWIREESQGLSFGWPCADGGNLGRQHKKAGAEGGEVLAHRSPIHAVSWMGSGSPYKILESYTLIQVVIHPCISSTSSKG